MAKVGSDSEALFTQHNYDEGESTMEDYFTYPLVVQALVSSSMLNLNITYDISELTEFQVTALVHQLEHVMDILCTETTKPLADLSFASPWDVEQALALNDIPEVTDATFHDLVSNQAQLNPDAVAIEAWDGSMTYQELDLSSGYLASHLLSRFGIQLD
ncbi:unnamed protein product, partial [Fusarium equiseti]